MLQRPYLSRTSTIGRLVLLTVLAMSFALIERTPAHAASLAVTTTADELNVDGDCSLREAVRAANLDQKVDACVAGSGADTISLPAGTYALTLGNPYEDLSASGDLDITGKLTITGTGAAKTIIDGTQLDRVIEVHSRATLTIAKVTIRNGWAQDTRREPAGGGIRNQGVLTVKNSVISGNRANEGGGIANEGTATVTASTISHNTGWSNGGGVFSANGPSTLLRITNSTISGNHGGTGGGIGHGNVIVTNSTISGNSAGNGGGVGMLWGNLTLSNVTISGNVASAHGGGVYTYGPVVNLNNVTIAENHADHDYNNYGEGGGVANDGGTVSVKNSVIAKNGVSDVFNDCSGPLISQGFNLIQVVAGCTLLGDMLGVLIGREFDPRLGPLQNNGGATFTHALLPGSAAIDAGNPVAPGSGGTACERKDQRNKARPTDGNGDGLVGCDMGAVERISSSTP